MKRVVYNKGFSLIELVVSVAVFTVAAILGTGVLMSVSVAQKKSIAVQEVQDSIGFAFEAMTREIRTGTSYHCGTDNNDFGTTPRDCDVAGGGGPSLTFGNQFGETVVYRVTSGQIEKSSDGGVNFLGLTSTTSGMNVNNIRFYVYGSSSADNIQPRVIVVVGAVVGGKFATEINLQSTLSQRLIDY